MQYKGRSCSGSCFVIFLISYFIFLLLDQATKWWALNNLTNRTIQIIPGFFDLTLRRNVGSAFGIRLLNPPAHLIITIAISIAFIYFMLRFLGNWKWWFFLGAGLFLSGAWGNLIDRLRWGFVIDFFEPSIWATFNIADITIIAGLVIIFIQIWIQGSAIEETKNQGV
ncbi:MAG: signal peptidase II [Atribacterota bacterium]|jgi:signal peptidase II|uniref:signal peptidase II n=1 Tax=Atribacter sp. TaxID=2847780 RepID=UPI00345E98F2|nr:signal peptidase II [Atribacterota bacterium]